MSKRSSNLTKRLARSMGRAIEEFQLIEEGDRILCAMSGGKDSFVMLHLLERLRRRAPVKFELLAVNVDQGYRGFRTDVLERYFREHGFTYHIERTNIAGVIDETMAIQDTHCSMCARLRRGVLYRLAPQLGCNKIALGHHADDLIETLLMSQFFNGELCSMPPLLRSRDGRNTVIRPLCYAWEEDIRRLSGEVGFPVICCACPACGDHSLQRMRMKVLLQKMETNHPGIKNSLLRALSNVRAGHLLDRRWLPLPKPNEKTVHPAAVRRRHANDERRLTPTGIQMEKRATVPSDRRPGINGQELHPTRRREREPVAADTRPGLAANPES